MSVIQRDFNVVAFCYGGLFTGSVRRWLHHIAVFDPVFSPPPDSVETITGGLFHRYGVNRMTTKTTQGKIRPNFNHRITYTPSEELRHYDLIEGIDRVTERASASISIIQSLCTSNRDDEGCSELNRISPDLVYFALDSVLQDIKDLAAIGVELHRIHAANKRDGGAA